MTPDDQAAAADPSQIIAELRRQLDERTAQRDEGLARETAVAAERDEALAQQTATAEVLGVINSSCGDLAPVFDAMLESAHTLCNAALGSLVLYDGSHLRGAATRGYPKEYVDLVRDGFPASQVPAFELLLNGELIVHVPDAAAAPMTTPIARAAVEIAGVRTMLLVPLQKNGAVLGYISAQRQEVQPFTDKQIALLQNFAAQAVIAMENARLITETREALEQQTATAEVLGVINSSPGDLAPVFEAMLEKATSLCGAAFGIMNTFDGERFNTVALHGVPRPLQESLLSTQPQPGRYSGPGRMLSGEDTVRWDDLAATPGYQSGDVRTCALVDLGGVRSYMAAALRKDGRLLGTLAAYRQEVRPFSDKQIALLQNFAAQAVIAMENARLITETREALEQQTATAEVLGVINSSPGDLVPVFDAILEKAHSLCGAEYGSLNLYNGYQLRAVAVRGVPEGFADRLRLGFRPGAEHPTRVLENGAAFVQIPDLAEATDPVMRTAFETTGMRTALFLPLRKDDRLLGHIVAARPEVRLYSDKQIALLQNFAAQAVIAMENARLITETREALEQQTATAEVLQVINSSPGDLAPVFDAMLEKALSICQATLGGMFVYEAGHFRTAALRGAPPPFADFLRQPLPPQGALAQIVEGDGLVQIADVTADPTYDMGAPGRRALADLGGARTAVWLALRKDDALLGVIWFYRTEVRPFTNKQIALLQNFAAQAVIAMENARLITETREALEQQTATAEVLGVINSSPGDLAPVFDAMLEKAMHLCEGAFGGLWVFDGDRYVATALRNVPEAYSEFLNRTTVVPGPGSAPYRFLHGERSVIQNIDLKAEENYRRGDPQRRALVDLGGARTALQVPLCRDDAVFGVITIYRKEIRPFSEKHIALLQNFAVQAVIAMENARLITETREALERQTATAEVLQVINSSPGHLAPVFDAMLEKATRLCDTSFGIMATYDGQHYQQVSLYGANTELTEALAQIPPNTAPHSGLGRIARGEDLVCIEDLATDRNVAARDPRRRALVEVGKVRSYIAVALRKDGKLLGAIAAYRQEVRPFTEKQIALLQNFAAQAVIAMENARLLTETREALEQQTATAEVLGVINSSPGDLAPVFDAMLEKAHALCGIDHGVFGTVDGERFRAVATRGLAEPLAALVRQPFVPSPGSPHERLMRGESMVRIDDLTADTQWPHDDPKRVATLAAGVRVMVFVPLRRDGHLLGFFTANRREARPFADREIALLQNFAAQAVIAMENARLITETREALEQQTATAEVLGVINSSPGDLAPVFDAMLEKAMHLCGAAFGEMLLNDDGNPRLAAARGVPVAFAEFRRKSPARHSPVSIAARIFGGQPVVHTIDAKDEELYRLGDPQRKALVDLGGARTTLAVALVSEGAVVGTISLARQRVQPFTEKQIELVQTFADQAVIAMENARLITETREALEQQTATAEVLQVINSSPGDLTPVFEAMLDKATRLCGAAFGVLWTYEGENSHAAAMHGVPVAFAEVLTRGPYPISSDNALGILLRGDAVLHLEDAADTETYRSGDLLRRAMVDLGGARTMLAVPLRKDHAVLGIFVIYRQEVRAFSEKQIALLQNFAAQAVIAMENARLLTETREALEQQTATAEVLGVINSSPGDLAPVFETILEKAHGLCDVAYGSLQLYDGEKFQAVAVHGLPERLAERLRQGYSPGPHMQGLLAGEAFHHILDMAEVDDPMARNVVELSGLRTLLRVALRKDDVLLGQIVAARAEVRPFTDKQIALLQNFATQAVIAMENARLITETREALEQQTATAEVLQVINSSPGDLVQVFDAMLEKALRLCEANFGMFWERNDDSFYPTALRGVPPIFANYLTREPLLPAQNSGLGRTAAGEPFVHIADIADSDAYRSGDPQRRALVDLGGGRTALWVGLRKESSVIGIFTIYRQEVKPFADKQIALLQNFAAQAVIAMDNARLLNEIRQRQAELRITFENMGDGVVMFDENLGLAAWNSNFQELLDLPDEVLRQRPSYRDYLRILANRGEFGTVDVEAELSRRLENTDQKFRQERTRPDGRVIEVRRNAVPDGGFVLIYSDITERKRSEEEIRAARDAAEAAYADLKTAQASLIHAEKMASLGQLTAGIAHEIKNPLNFVNNFAGLSVELLDELKEETAPALATLERAKQAEIDETIEMLTGNLEKIAEHGKRADGIVKSMLEHSRGVTGERREVDLNALVEEALNLAYHGARAQDQSFNITMERDLDPHLGPIALAPQEITRVFLNLFGNGFYAAAKRARETADGFRPVLTVTTRDLGEAVEVRVRDNGTGIPPEIRDKLFQPFFTTKPTGEGTGLGLSISYDIVTQEHCGTIEVESEPGSFTEFTVRLPRRSEPNVWFAS